MPTTVTIRDESIGKAKSAEQPEKSTIIKGITKRKGKRRIQAAQSRYAKKPAVRRKKYYEEKLRETHDGRPEPRMPPPRPTLGPSLPAQTTQLTEKKVRRLAALEDRNRKAILNNARRLIKKNEAMMERRSAWVRGRKQLARRH